jgi:hypothetical protein
MRAKCCRISGSSRSWPWPEPESQAEFAGTYEQPVEPLDRGQRRAPKALAGFDHREDDRLLGRGERIAAGPQRHPRRAVRAAALGRVAGSSDQRLRFVDALHHRRDDAGGTRVERVPDPGPVEPRQADQGCRAVRRDRADRVKRRAVVEQAVLEVEGDGLGDAAGGDHLRQMGVRDREPGVARRPARCSRLVQRCRRDVQHDGLPSLSAAERAVSAS